MRGWCGSLHVIPMLSRERQRSPELAKTSHKGELWDQLRDSFSMSNVETEENSQHQLWDSIYTHMYMCIRIRMQHQQHTHTMPACYPCLIFLVLGMELRTLNMLSRGSTTELHLHPCYSYIFLFFSYTLHPNCSFSSLHCPQLPSIHGSSS